VTVRLVATDLDGTIVRSDGAISARTARALRAAEDSGLVVVLVTGRPPRWMGPVAAATGHTGVAICANGALLYDLHTETVVSARLLDPEQLRSIAGRLRGVVPGLLFAVEYGMDFAHEPGYEHGWEIGVPEVRVGPPQAILDRPAAKLLARHPTLGPDELLALAVGVLGADATVTHSSTRALLEISAYGVTKASALASLAESAGIAPAEVVAFGDMPNDLAMLAWAGHSVAVANAHPQVLAAADEVTGSNDADGVALVIERILTASATEPPEPPEPPEPADRP
jgi:hydroxymethylpyrimidine pyrophosphatase-like HAD family hydrolase